MRTPNRLARLGLSQLQDNPQALQQKLMQDLANDQLAYRSAVQATSPSPTDPQTTAPQPTADTVANQVQAMLSRVSQDGC